MKEMTIKLTDKEHYQFVKKGAKPNSNTLLYLSGP
jgi:hypothetical protein